MALAGAVVITLKIKAKLYIANIHREHRKYKQKILPYLLLREHNLLHAYAKC